MEATPGRTVILARHGRTSLNLQGRLRGRLDPPLDTVGRDQAERLGVAMVRYDPGRILSSPLLRARQTADAVARSAPGVRVEIEVRLADRDYGAAAGLTLAEVEAGWGSLEAVPGTEPLEAVQARALEVLDELHPTRSREVATAVLVTHDAVSRAVLAALPSRRDPGMPLTQRTGCWNVLASTEDSWTILEVDVVPE